MCVCRAQMILWRQDGSRDGFVRHNGSFYFTVFVVFAFIILIIMRPCHGSSGQAVSVSAEAQVEYQASLDGICERQSGYWDR